MGGPSVSASPLAASRWLWCVSVRRNFSVGTSSFLMISGFNLVDFSGSSDGLSDKRVYFSGSGAVYTASARPLVFHAATLFVDGMSFIRPFSVFCIAMCAMCVRLRACFASQCLTVILPAPTFRTPRSVTRASTSPSRTPAGYLPWTLPAVAC